MKFFCGLDLGQAADYTALVIAERLEQKPKPAYHLRHIQRFKLGTPYPEIVENVKSLLSVLETRHRVSTQEAALVVDAAGVEAPVVDVFRAALIVDATGVGAPVVDMFRVARLAVPLYAVSIHGGDTVTREGLSYRVPKRNLVSTVQVLLQSGRLKIAESLPETKTLVRELLNFKAKIDPVTAHDSYAAWRENIHDDLVLATALALWVAERIGGRFILPFRM